MLELRTLAIKVWPEVPGLSWSTLTKVGFLSGGFDGAFPSCCEEAVAIVVFPEDIIDFGCVGEEFQNPNPRNVNDRMGSLLAFSLFSLCLVCSRVLKMMTTVRGSYIIHVFLGGLLFSIFCWDY